ncbi:MAG: hypothetical protein LUI12_04555 [Clostridiales bacterium]|nr:hypothetical protein [Clostridiales bacterium]
MKRQLPGVYTAVRKDGSIYYRASLTYRNKHISLGSYASASDAHQSYLSASALLQNAELGLSSYQPDSPLAFEKWICLLNFRDNGLYFATPIYIRPKFFYYYFSPSDFFIFDTEDLFYYSSRKISHRGNHYFVADYGMQVNIMNRYGIKNYAVEGRDYRFINGNNHDFRYENIEIINRYNGVCAIPHQSGVRYQVKIHIKGNVTVGTYQSELEAAIAYNKAIDLLKKAGINKAYTPNYMEGISPAVYADLYSSVKVSSYLTRYRSE